MKYKLLFFIFTIIWTLQLDAKDVKYNDLINFLIGKWDNVSYEVTSGREIKRESYSETMTGKDEHTVTITAHNFKNGKDVTEKDMHLQLDDKKIIMRQGAFKAEGYREGNVYYLRGNHQDFEFRFRLYTMGDKFVFHRETWKNNKMEQIDMSYLVKKREGE